jgi:hypothetical protein
MNKKVVTIAVIVGLAVALGVGLRAANRADAAANDCYSDKAGPSEPTICN